VVGRIGLGAPAVRGTLAEPVSFQVTGRRDRPWPLLGHFPAFHADATGFLLRLAQQQGDVARFRLGRTDAVLLSHPDHVRQVLVDRAADFTKGRLMQRARRLLGDGLLTSEGEMHRGQRRRIQPVFARERLPAYAALVPTLAALQTAGWRDGMAIRVDAEMDALAMKVVARSLLGTHIHDEVPALGRALGRLARWAPLLAAPGGRILEKIRLPVFGRLGDAIEMVEGIIDRQIDEGRTEGALLGALLHSDDGAPMAGRLVRDEVMTIFLAGHDTTSAALTWTWLLLGHHPAANRRLQAELAEVLGGRQPNAADLERLPYTDAVIKETLRLYPPIGRIGRRPIRDLDLDPPALRKDTAVFLSPFVTGRDPRWFPEPAAFRPERWSEPGPDRPRFAWFPFGAGPRSCIGEHFARMALILAVATMAQRWRLRPSTPDLPRARSLLTLKPRGAVWMVAKAD
jgi:cytochrome P450